MPGFNPEFTSLAGIPGDFFKGYAVSVGSVTLTAANSGLIVPANPLRKSLIVQNITAGNELTIDIDATSTIVLPYLSSLQCDRDFPFAGQVRGTPSANSTARYIELSVQP